MDIEQEMLELLLVNVRDALEAKKIVIVSEQTLIKALPVVIEGVEHVKSNGVSTRSLTGLVKKDLAMKTLLYLVDESSQMDDEKKGV